MARRRGVAPNPFCVLLAPGAPGFGDLSMYNKTATRTLATPNDSTHPVLGTNNFAMSGGVDYPATAISEDFTIEAFFYWTGPNQGAIFSSRNSGAVGILMLILNTGFFSCNGPGTGGLTSLSALSANAWNYGCFQRYTDPAIISEPKSLYSVFCGSVASGNAARQVTFQQNSGAITQDSTWSIGSDTPDLGAINAFTGNISNVKVETRALYPGATNIVIATSPLTPSP